jgi:uncharacterized membrane protein YfcA
MLYLYAALIGLCGGVASGLFGVGGGIVMVPGMVVLLGRDIKTAIGVSLAVIVPAACVGVFQHHRFGHIDWRLAAAIIPLALVGSFSGAWLAKILPAPTLTRLFGGFLVLVGFYLLLRRR